MTLTLSSADLGQVEHALATILSPLSFETSTEWADAVMAACQPLFKADHMLFGHPLDGQFVMQGQGPRIEEAVDAYLADYWRVDPGMSVRRPALGLTIYHRDHVYDRYDLPRTMLYHEWCVPYRLLDKIGIAAEGALDRTAIFAGAPPLPPLLHFFRSHDGTADEARDRLGLLAIIKPSLMSALRTIGQFRARRTELMAFFDATPLGVLIVDLEGRSLYENAAFATLLPDTADRLEIRGVAGAAAQTLRPVAHRATPHGHTSNRCAGPSTTRNTRRARKHDAASEPTAPWRLHRTRDGTFRLYSSLLGAGMFSRDDTVVVTVERLTTSALSAETLRTTFRCTPREIEVAHLLARGLQNREIATTLGMSYNTARRHVEMILLKLSVSSRGAAGAVLRGEMPAPHSRF